MTALTEGTVLRLAPDDQVLTDGRGLIRKNSMSNLGVSADGTWLLGECKGSTKEPYKVSADLANPDSPMARCSCPSRKFPCKHGVALMLLYAQDAGKFGPREPDEALLAKRDKAAARAEKKGDEATQPKKVNTAAQAKKVKAQRDGLDLLEKLLVDLVASGQWFERSRLERLGRQQKQLTDAFLKGAAYSVNRLILLGDADYKLFDDDLYDWEDDGDETSSKQKGIPEEERLAEAADLIGQLWATVQKGRNYLDDKIAGDETAAEAEAVLEGVLGKTWQLSELKEKGYFRQNLSLLELAFERWDDAAAEQRVEVSHQIELGSGDVLQAISLRPHKAMQHVAEQPSYSQPLTVPEAAVYPGFMNRRVRWEKGAEKAVERTADHLQAAYAKAIPDFKTALDSFRKQIKHPLAPRDAVMLLRCEKIGKVGDKIVLEDAAGLRIVAADRRKDYSNVANLSRAAGMLGKDKPAVLVRLFVQPLHNTILAQPRTALTASHHLRLGL